MIKKVLLGSIILIILVAVGKLAVTRSNIRSLEKISDPKSFSLNFDTSGKTQAELEVGGLKGRTIKSPFFPHSTLKTETLKETHPVIISREHGRVTEDLSEKGVKINTDPFWNVFWVEVQPEGQGYVTQFYGPYQIN